MLDIKDMIIGFGLGLGLAALAHGLGCVRCSLANITAGYRRYSRTFTIVVMVATTAEKSPVSTRIRKQLRGEHLHR